MTQSKKELRKVMRDRLRRVSPAGQTRRNTAICTRIAVLPQYKKAGRIMAYLNMPGEASLDGLMEQAIREGRQVYVPRCVGPGRMEAVLLPSVAAAEAGAYGIRTAPEGSLAADPADLDMILIPGLAFDVWGHRLGRGAGFYDRFLQSLRPAGMLAVAWDMQIVPLVPIEAHDVIIPSVLTETRYITQLK
ncbi:MAG: 5-formyltetrahydrofolate cyclo-ligase [Megasphaera cerevisiae]|nr:5-formyltetrahydrofolate cyclo-ligase [Megasphaera cerevisiae]